MKKEEITIRVTPENVKEYWNVLEANSQSVDKELNNNLLDCYPVMYICPLTSTGDWCVFYTVEDDSSVLGCKTISWSPSDLNLYFQRGRDVEEVKDWVQEENDADRARFRLKGSDPLCRESPLCEEDTKYVIGDGEGGFAEVELEKDMVVVKLPGGSLQPIKRSDLFKVVKA